MTIVDVSYYVRPLTPPDQETRSRDTSAYFPSQVVPMLPEVLSNGLCSLNPQADRLYMVCGMAVPSKGRLTGFKFCETVMSPHARLICAKVWHMLQGDQELREQYAPLVKRTEELHNLYKVLDKAREEHGGISLESEEAKFIFNAERHIERIERTQYNNARKLTEEHTIMANISAARFVGEAKEPTLFRIHDKPTTETINSFHPVLSELGLELSGGNKPELCDYAELLESIADHPDAKMLRTMLLRLMKQAVYDPENHGHFGLALQSYAHSTLPIRRCPDLSLRRTIKCLLAQERGHKDNTTETGGYHYSMGEMPQLGQHCLVAECRVDEATHDVSDWLEYNFILGQVGNVFKGVIVSVVGFGFFIRLDELFIDGLMHVSSLDNNYYRFNQVGQRLMGESSGQMYRPNDHVGVCVEAVNIDERKTDFNLIPSERASRNESKTACEKAKKGDAGKNTDRHRQMGEKVNFEPDGAFHGEKKDRAKPQADKNTARKKGNKKAEKLSVRMLKIVATIKAKRAVKKRTAQ